MIQTRLYFFDFQQIIYAWEKMEPALEEKRKQFKQGQYSKAAVKGWNKRRSLKNL